MKRNNSLWLTVEASPGTCIHDACRDAAELANKLGIHIWFDFNGIKVLCRPGDDPERTAKAWQDELKSTHSFKIASARDVNPRREEERER